MGGNQAEPTKPGRQLFIVDQPVSRGFQSVIKETLKSGRKGQDLVEFILVMPLLILVLFGAIDLGRLFHASITITNAARVAARYVTMNPGVDEFGTARALAVQEAQGSGIKVTLANVSAPDCYIEFARCVPLEKVTMRVSYDFQLLIGPILPGGFVVPGNPCPDGRNLCFKLTRTAEMLVQ